MAYREAIPHQFWRGTLASYPARRLCSHPSPHGGRALPGALPRTIPRLIKLKNLNSLFQELVFSSTLFPKEWCGAGVRTFLPSKNGGAVALLLLGNSILAN